MYLLTKHALGVSINELEEYTVRLSLSLRQVRCNRPNGGSLRPRYRFFGTEEFGLRSSEFFIAAGCGKYYSSAFLLR